MLFFIASIMEAFSCIKAVLLQFFEEHAYLFTFQCLPGLWGQKGLYNHHHHYKFCEDADQ